MPIPNLQITIGDYNIDNVNTKFLEFEMDAHLFMAADSFMFKLVPRPGLILEPSKAPGLPIQVMLNGNIECTGIVDSVKRTISKTEGQVLTITGRDLMGYLGDTCVYKKNDLVQDWGDVSKVSNFFDFINILLQQSITNLPPGLNKVNAITQISGVKNAPNINANNPIAIPSIPFGDIVEPNPIVIIGGDDLQNVILLRISPGEKIAECIRKACMSYGLLFWCMPDGTFAIGVPVQSGLPSFNITSSTGTMTDYLDADIEDDITNRYSDVLIIDQKDAMTTFSDATDTTAPFYKPLVTRMAPQGLGLSAKQWAILQMKKFIYEGWKATFTMMNFTNNGKNYGINAICSVNDPISGLRDNFLIVRRTFRLSKEKGESTTLQLAKLGVFPT